MSGKKLDLTKLHFQTMLAQAGRDAQRSERAVNPPVQRATTLLARDVGELYDAPKTYALDGMAVQEALRETLLAIEGGAGAVLAPSGLTACTLAILTVARADSEILITDSVYKPTRRFCDHSLKRYGVKPVYYDPRIGAGIAELINERTCAVFMESPGSLTFEVQDVPAICAAAKARGVPTIIDNTWSAGVYFKPFEHGVDISVQALSKYQAGHADAFMGSIIGATQGIANRIWLASKDLGLGVSPDDAYLVLRGIRSLDVRLERQSKSALEVARWLETRPEVARVLHPALESSEDHALWKRDFTGASGLFGLILKPASAERVAAMLQSLDLFGLGFSWGGFESLAIPCDQQIIHTAKPWRAEGPTIRISIGLEHPGDLIADLTRAFARLN